MNEPGEIPQGQPDAEDVILENARRLLASQQANQTPLVLHTTLETTVLTEDMIELAKRTKQLPLSSAGIGDVVWWKTASGTTGYFAVEEPYTDDGTGLGGMKSGNGRFLIERREGHSLGNQRGTGQILGATFGGGLKKDTILKGSQLEYEFRKDDGTKNYKTTPVTEMGIIKATQKPQE